MGTAHSSSGHSRKQNQLLQQHQRLRQRQPQPRASGHQQLSQRQHAQSPLEGRVNSKGAHKHHKGCLRYDDEFSQQLFSACLNRDQWAVNVHGEPLLALAGTGWLAERSSSLMQTMHGKSAASALERLCVHRNGCHCVAVVVSSPYAPVGEVIWQASPISISMCQVIDAAGSSPARCRSNQLLLNSIIAGGFK